MDTRFWGPPGWKLLHQIAYQYPENPTPEDKLNYGIFYSNLGNVLPCKYCRNSFTKYIKNLPYIECRDQNDEKRVCTQIPEVVYMFLFGNF